MSANSKMRKGYTMEETYQQRRKEEEALVIKNLNDDVEQMNFEIKVRQLMRDLIEPLINKSKTDREMIFRMEKAEEGLARRLDVLEKAVYKKDDDGTPTLFVDMESKILQMQVDLKVTFKALQAQMEATEKKLFDQYFLLDQRIMKIENYKEQIEANKQSTASLQKIVEDTFQNLRGSLESNASNIITEANRLDGRITDITRMCDELPLKMTECENMCAGADALVVQLKGQVSTLMQQQYAIDAKKLDITEQEAYAKSIHKQIVALENQHDANANKTKELQNWIDIYMPLRFQHQLQETMKDCLPRKGRYMLSVVSNEMCSQLRERMFNDIDDPLMVDRCLYVIKELHLEAELLAQENRKVIDEKAANYSQIEGDQEQKEQKENPVLAKYESNGNRVGDADSEALGKLQEELTAQMEVDIEKLRTELTTKLKEYSEKQEKEIRELQNSVNSSHDSLTAFQHTLKEEIELAKESSKRQNVDALAHVKNVADQLSKLREKSNRFLDTETRLRDILAAIVGHQTLLNQVANQHWGSGAGGDEYLDQLLMATGRSSSVTNKLQKQQSSSSQPRETEKDTAMLKANEALKKLNIVMFRQKMGSSDDYLQSFHQNTTSHHGTSSFKRYSVNQRANGVLFSEIQPHIINARTVRSKAHQQSDYDLTSYMNRRDAPNFEQIGELDTFLRGNESDASLGQKTVPSSYSPLKSKGMKPDQVMDAAGEQAISVPTGRMEDKTIIVEHDQEEAEPARSRNNQSIELSFGDHPEDQALHKHNSIVEDLRHSDLSSQLFDAPSRDRTQYVTQSALSHYHSKKKGRQYRSKPLAQSVNQSSMNFHHTSEMRLGRTGLSSTLQSKKGIGVFTGTRMFPTSMLPKI